MGHMPSRDNNHGPRISELKFQFLVHHLKLKNDMDTIIPYQSALWRIGIDPIFRL